MDNVVPMALYERLLPAAEWRKASHSGTGECFSLAVVGDHVAIRNSRNAEAGTLFFSRAQMGAWVEGCKAGQFSDLT